jgi:tyrosyl-tRNA synthetase
LHLYRKHGVSLQVCGADQWGNSIAGVELIRRIAGDEAHVWSAPLVVNKATGIKFGKSEDGAVWLDETKTSVYKFYQFWLNVDDDSAADFLKIYTLLSRDAITEVMADFDVDRAGRKAQKALAYEVTCLVHGQEKADSVVRVSDLLFGGDYYASLTNKDFVSLKAELPLADVTLGDTLIAGVVNTGLAASNSEARRFLEQGSIYLNGQQISLERTVTAEDRLDGRHAILRRGKNANAVLQISE